jgi:hypothetical protein
MRQRTYLNTVRERTRIQRGWKKDDTPLKEGQRLYYNFIRENQGLANKTPAEMAGLYQASGENSGYENLRVAAHPPHAAVMVMDPGSRHPSCASCMQNSVTVSSERLTRLCLEHVREIGRSWIHDATATKTKQQKEHEKRR